MDPIEYGESDTAYRLSDADLKGLPSTYEEKQAALREKIIELFEERLDGIITRIEGYYIGRSAFSRYIHGKNGISKTAITKLVIGLMLTQEQYEELLTLKSTPFDYDCRFDYIAACALRDGDELETFFADLKKYGCKDIENA